MDQLKELTQTLIRMALSQRNITGTFPYNVEVVQREDKMISVFYETQVDGRHFSGLLPITEQLLHVKGGNLGDKFSGTVEL